MPEPPFDNMTHIKAVLESLRNSDVDFIVIGGVAGNIHGSARVTYDLDLVYDRSRGNIERLCAALKPFQPYPRDVPPGLPFSWDTHTLRSGLNFTLATGAGPLDLFGEVAGGGTFGDLLPHATVVSLFGLEVRVVNLDKLIDLKRAAGRGKDLMDIAELQALRELSGDTQL